MISSPTPYSPGFPPRIIPLQVTLKNEWALMSEKDLEYHRFYYHANVFVPNFSLFLFYL